MRNKVWPDAVERRCSRAPFFSICIPQFNRTSFLLEALRCLVRQTDMDFEVCISDDCSTDGRQGEVLAFLQESPMAFAYIRQPRNVRYDANLRTAISLARGRYCLLMGNDDTLTGPDALAGLKADISAHGPAGVIITDYEDFANGSRGARIRQTANYGSGPRVAADHFRNFSFVSGVVLETMAAQAVASESWDGSEMYQTFVGSRLIASGRSLLELDRVLVRKDIRIPGERVDSYAARPRLYPCPIQERQMPLRMLGRLVVDAVRPYLEPCHSQALLERIILQLLLFTYPFWILEYRRVQSWRFAIGVCLGMRPDIVMEGLELCPSRQFKIKVLYLLVTTCGLTVPTRLFERLRPRLYAVAKSIRSPSELIPLIGPIAAVSLRKSTKSGITAGI